MLVRLDERVWVNPDLVLRVVQADKFGNISQRIHRTKVYFVGGEFDEIMRPADEVAKLLDV